MTIIKQANEDKYNIRSTKDAFMILLEAQQKPLNDTINQPDRHNSTEQDLDANRIENRIRSEQGLGPGVPRQTPHPVREVGGNIEEAVPPGLGVKDRQNSVPMNIPENSPLNNMFKDTLPVDEVGSTEGQLEAPDQQAPAAAPQERKGNPQSGLNRLVYEGKPMTGNLNDHVIDFGNGQQMNKFKTVTRDKSKKAPEEPAPTAIRVHRGGGKPGKR